MTRSLRAQRRVRSTVQVKTSPALQAGLERKKRGYKSSRFAEVGDKKIKFSQVSELKQQQQQNHGEK